MLSDVRIAIGLTPERNIFHQNRPNYCEFSSARCFDLLADLQHVAFGLREPLSTSVATLGHRRFPEIRPQLVARLRRLFWAKCA